MQKLLLGVFKGLLACSKTPEFYLLIILIQAKYILKETWQPIQKQMLKVSRKTMQERQDVYCDEKAHTEKNLGGFQYKFLDSFWVQYIYIFL